MEWRRLKIALFVSTYMLLLVWVMFIVQYMLGDDMPNFAIMPREWSSVANFLVSPFVHANLEHLFNNSLAFFFLSLSCFYFYGGIALWVILGGIGSGLLVWLFGREGYHIGLSGVCYCLSSFLFFSGIIRRNVSLMTISLIVIFLQSEMIWGLFPSLNEPLHISWEGHVAGGLVGFVLAFIYRKHGPSNDKIADDVFDDEEDDSLPLDADSGSSANKEEE